MTGMRLLNRRNKRVIAMFLLSVLILTVISAAFASAANPNYTIDVKINDSTYGDSYWTKASHSTATQGTSVTLSARTRNGGVFDYWEVLSGDITINNPTSPSAASFIMPASDVYIRAVFSSTLVSTNYTIIATAGTGGTVSGGGTYQAGSTVTLYATPFSGYGFDGWYEGNSKVSANAIYSFIAYSNRSLEAFFSPITNDGFFSSGDGSTVSPYIITTAEQLAYLAERVNACDAKYNSKNYKLGNDIDLSSYGKNWNDGKGWIPIGSADWISEQWIDYAPFLGVFDGDGKTVSGLYINDANSQSVGLFGFVENGEVKNLGITKVDVNGLYNVGGLVGLLGSQGYVTNCFSTGLVKGVAWVGGIAGFLMGDSSRTAGSYSACDVSGYEHIGGIAGLVNGSVSNCYSIGSISGDRCVGGVVGFLDGNGRVSNSAAFNPSVICSDSANASSAGIVEIGRVVGRFFAGSNSNGTISNNVAFSGMGYGGGLPFANEKTSNGLNGADITSAAIIADGTINRLFTSAGGWTTQNGKLPGLFGKTVDMPPHISNDEEVIQNPPSKGSSDGASSWAAAEIDEAIALGIIPDEILSNYQLNITRVDFCKTVIRMLMAKCGTVNNEERFISAFGIDLSSAPFTDTSDEYIKIAYALQIVNGTGNNKFSPDNQITRQEAAAMLSRSAAVFEFTRYQNSPAIFADEGTFAAWAKSPIDFVSANTIMLGTGNNKFSPHEHYTREQAIVTMLRLFKAFPRDYYSV